jgi:hypothetical protein
MEKEVYLLISRCVYKNTLLVAKSPPHNLLVFFLISPHMMHFSLLPVYYEECKVAEATV